MDTRSEAPTQDAPGWYGKLALLGDFAERRLPRDVVEQADAWLSAGMGSGRALFGEAWLEHYLTAPLCCFAWAPGVVDAGWWFGVMMPSSDNVGRYFPLLVASRRPQAPRDSAALAHLQAWFDHLAEAATATLDDGATVAAFEEALGRAPPWPGSGAASLAPPAARRAGDHGLPGAAAGLSSWVQGTAAEALQARFDGCSIWWHPGREGSPTMAAAKVVRGLPEPAAFALWWLSQALDGASF